MKINAEHLHNTLERMNPTLIMLMGEDMLLKQEAADAVFDHLNARGFTLREKIEMSEAHDTLFWRTANTLSLFATKRVIDLRLSSLRMGDNGSQALQDFIDHPPQDTCLLITAPYDASAEKNAWVTAFEKKGLMVRLWPVDMAAFPAWITSRLQKAGLPHSDAIVAAFVLKTEGNLLAASQHIHKLSLLQLSQPLEEASVLGALTEANHYTVFDLVSAILTGASLRAMRIFHTLIAEKTELPLMLGALCQALRATVYLLDHQHQGSFQDLCQRQGIFKKRQQDIAAFIARCDIHVLHTALARAAHIDRMIKGAEKNNACQALERLVLSLALQKEITCA